jgi:hypothetical protein
MSKHPDYDAYPKTPEWYDSFHAAYARNIERMVAGQTLDVGDNERSIEEQTVEIDRIHSVTVGIDAEGIFAAINVIDTEGNGWSLYQDGTISDEDDQTVGRHELKTLPAPTKPTGVL